MLRALVAALILLQQQQPTFKTGVEVVAVDVHVVDKQGNPIENLRADEFEVAIGGRQRRVASVELVSYRYARRETAEVPVINRPATGESGGRPRRLFVVAVDEHSLHPSTAMVAVKAADRFIERLQPDDTVGLYAYPTGGAKHDPTLDHASVRRKLQGITGLFEEPNSRFNLSPSETVDIASGDRDLLTTVSRRECRTPSPGCTQRDIEREAISLVGFMEMRIAQSVGGLRALVQTLGAAPGRKILVVVSGGLISPQRTGGRASSHVQIASLGREAAAANVAVYALHLDWSFFQAMSSRAGLRLSYYRDSNMAATGLEVLAGAAGGSVARVYGTSPDRAFDRVLLETSAHYLVGVEVDALDRNGQAHPIRVKVKRGGATVRARTEVVLPKTR